MGTAVATPVREADTQTANGSGFAQNGVERVALYVMPGDFERRGLVTDRLNDEYDASTVLATETQYLVAGARVVWKAGTTGSAFERDARVTLALSNLLQSTSGVVDLVSGELLEVATYYPNGARETLRANSEVEEFALEPVGFTGKEDDSEVGLVYFGMRYLMPHLGRWASPDPLQIHAGGGGEFGNSYHYVSGNLLQARDPLGLSSQYADAEYIPADNLGEAMIVHSDGCSADMCFKFAAGDAQPAAESPESVEVVHEVVPEAPAPATIGPPSEAAWQNRSIPGLRRIERQRRDALYRSGDRQVAPAAGTGVPEFMAGLVNMALRSPLTCCGEKLDGQDVLGFLYDRGIDLGLNRYSIEYGEFTEGPNLQDAMVLASTPPAAGASDDTVTLYHGSTAWEGEAFSLGRAVELSGTTGASYTPVPGIYLTDDFLRAAQGYGRGGHVVRVQVPRSFAESIRQLGGPGGNQPEFFVNTLEGVAVLNESLRILPTREAIQMFFRGVF